MKYYWKLYRMLVDTCAYPRNQDSTLKRSLTFVSTAVRRSEREGSYVPASTA